MLLHATPVELVEVAQPATVEERGGSSSPPLRARASQSTASNGTRNGQSSSGVLTSLASIMVLTLSRCICKAAMLSSREGGGILAEVLPARPCSILQTS